MPAAKAATGPHGRKMQPKPGRMSENRPAIDEVHILWITAGLGCDGDSVSITAATQPSIEDVVLGAIPGLPKVHLHNPVIAYRVRRRFLEYFIKPRAGKLRPFRAGDGRLDPERKYQQGRLLGGVWHRSQNRATDHH